MKKTILKVNFKDHRGEITDILQNEKINAITRLTIKKGKVRGNHYHTRKVEWFCVPTGTGQLLLKDRETGKISEVMMGVDDLKTIRIDPGTLHAIKNVGEEDMVLLVYSNEKFDPEDPDTFYEKILE